MLELVTGKEERARGDLEIARSAATGDESAKRRLVSMLFGRVRSTVRYLCADHRDQDDFIQLSLLQILKSVATYEGRSTIDAWADRIAVRTTMRHLKRIRSKDARFAPDEQLNAGAVNAVRDEHSRQLIRRQLARSLHRLSPERRAVIVLRMVHGYGIEEIAEITGAGVNTVRDRLARGRRQLKGILEKDPVFAAWSGV